MSYEDWVMHMRIGIMSASIARLCHEKMALGLGFPDADDMHRFSDDAATIADIWQDTIIPKELV